jgi:hypothetical protein
MRSSTAKKNSNVVYVIGAGFSKGAGYPLTSELLPEVWGRLRKDTQALLGKVIRFHHPYFDPTQKKSFPNIEELLTEISVNLQMFSSSRIVEGNFRRTDLEKVQRDLLYAIATWFHSLFNVATSKSWLRDFVDVLKQDNVTIVSFNWDLLLDHLLFGDPTAESYGLSGASTAGFVLLKPHGSMNWFTGSQVKKVPRANLHLLLDGKREEDSVYCFRFPRGIKSNVRREYMPLLITPTFVKEFDSSPIYEKLWIRVTRALSTANKVVFVGYSLPPSDLQAQFILRCGFHYQADGLRTSLGKSKSRPTGAANVLVINPDKEVFKRVRNIVGPKSTLSKIPLMVEDWIATL